MRKGNDFRKFNNYAVPVGRCVCGTYRVNYVFLHGTC